MPDGALCCKRCALRCAGIAGTGQACAVLGGGPMGSSLCCRLLACNPHHLWWCGAASFVSHAGPHRKDCLWLSGWVRAQEHLVNPLLLTLFQISTADIADEKSHA